MIKRLVFVLVLLAFPVAASAGELSCTISHDSDAIISQLRLDMEEWARHPTAATGCNGGDCCVDASATDAKCLAFAQNFRSNPTFWIRSILVCIQADSDWACHVEGTTPQMYCETVPATAAVRLEDVARCVSEQAGAQT